MYKKILLSSSSLKIHNPFIYTIFILQWLLMILMFYWLNLKWNFAVVVQSLTHVQFFPTPWTAACQSFLSFIMSWNLLKFVSIETVILSNDLMLCFSLPLLPSIFPSVRVFSNESALHIRWPKFWSFSINMSPSNEYSGLISFRIDQFDLHAIQETLKSVLQLHSLKASILQHSAFFMVQLSHLYMTTWKTIALTMGFCWQSDVSAF